MEAFSEVPLEGRTKEMKEAIERGAEFLLMHRLFKADHHDFRVIKQEWLHFGFPWFYRYDVLRGLLVLARLDYTNDERLKDAIELLLAKQGPDGRWVLESTPAGRMHASLEPKGKPSKWVTLKALRVLKFKAAERRSLRQFSLINPHDPGTQRPPPVAWPSV